MQCLEVIGRCGLRYFQISKLEVDRPERMSVALSEFHDYPPRILVDLSPPDQTSPVAELRVTGLKDERSFTVANECEFVMMMSRYCGTTCFTLCYCRSCDSEH